jgi:hypothetical protein
MAYTALCCPITAQVRVMSVHVRFVVNKMTLGQNFLQVFFISPYQDHFASEQYSFHLSYTYAEPSYQLTAPSVTAIRSCIDHPCINQPLL